MQDNAQGAMTRFNSALESAQISIGTAFLPAMATAAEAGAKFFGWLAGNETLTNVAIGIGVVSVALAGFVAAVSAGAAVVNAYKTASIACNAVSKAFKACTILSTAAQWAMNAAMYACPIGLFIAGVTAIIAVGYALYTHWDAIKQFLSAFGTVRQLERLCLLQVQSAGRLLLEQRLLPTGTSSSSGL